ncbi:bifunctional biotin--[acetyl-CoA-carboxylase] ligase/biotin operon repressor BirA [Sulfuricaulis sp.]|jgi:BirA family biotin operon repressor/biotin-[acetyl-CoA-carboxylase] ligase|uniref:bifunctional biotin--[acetyl-CoA-carboxylase] ligase/biotin operon repressor BirA n=1 Tax=Sulfuricaulis sp. TaxID=2003553 RepID=UPI0035597A6F
MSTRAEILRMLSDGAFHSGTDLGKRLGITRAAVCKNIRRLTQSGLDVHRVTGRGYKLDAPLTLLNRSRILKHLGAAAADFRDRLHVLDETDSTNRHLAELISHAKTMNGMVCLAEAQSGGRGRRGRAWVATPYHNLMFSMAWQFPGGPGLVSGLSLAAGLAVLQALEEYGVDGTGLKWPNDVLWDGRKLAGLLADVQGESAGPTQVILGVGVNGYIGREDAERIDQPWVDLRNILGETADRNRLAALVMRHLRSMFQEFAAKGFAPFREAWSSRHLYHGRRVRLIQGDREFLGTVEGIDENGGLIVHLGKDRQVFHSGEISVRPMT